MKDNQLLEMIESYLNGEMTVEERAQFDALRKKDATIDAKIAEHKQFTSLLKQYNERLSLQNRLDEIHKKLMYTR
jgi:serine protease Do